MTAATVAWLIVAAASAVIYFAIAVVVTVYGVKDLRKLLDGAEQVGRPPDR